MAERGFDRLGLCLETAVSLFPVVNNVSPLSFDN